LYNWRLKKKAMAPELLNKCYVEAVELLKQLIATPSFSKEENHTATIIQHFFDQKNILVERVGNNIIVRNKYFNSQLPTLLLNSHHDTVKPNGGYTKNPFEPIIVADKLFGLGSNDAGGALVSLAVIFLHYYESEQLPFNIIYAATAEEEISGKGGIESILPKLGNIKLAIVGEPTKMQMAVAERGLLVIDCIAKGKAGHAARNEGINAIYEAMNDIAWFRNYRFSKVSEWLGEVSMNVTIINAGKAHNQVPDGCSYTVDIRLNDCYTHEEVLATIKANITSEVKERSTRIRPSHIEMQHPFVQVAVANNINLYGSPTTSDMALMPFNSVKIGPGDSARSHSADEFIYLNEIQQGISTYQLLINNYILNLQNNKS